MANSREVGDDARVHIRRRDGSEEKEADVARNGSLAKDRSHHGYDEHKREKERLGSQHDDESRRDKDSYHSSHQQDKVWLVPNMISSAKPVYLRPWLHSSHKCWYLVYYLLIAVVCTY